MNRRIVVALGCSSLLGGVAMLGSLVPGPWKSNTDNSQTRLYREWRQRPLEVTSEELKAQPFQPETLRAAHVFAEEWGWVAGRAAAVREHYQGRAFTPGEPRLHQDLVELQPALQALTTLLAQPDFELAAFRCDQAFCADAVMPLPDYNELEGILGLMGLHAADLANEGRVNEALEAVRCWARGARVSPCDPTLGKIVACRVAQAACAAWGTLVERCDTREPLLIALAEQTHLAARLEAPFPALSETVFNHLWVLRELGRRGVAVNPTQSFQSLSEQQLCALSYQAQADYLRERVLPDLGRGPMVPLIEKRIGECLNEARMLQRGAGWWQALRPGRAAESEDLPFTQLTLNQDIMAQRLRRATAQVHALRLRTAERLYRLEHGTPATGPEALVPEYLPAWPPRQAAPLPGSETRQVAANTVLVGSGEPIDFPPKKF